jgi:L-galactono-1,4-lactone dehydrogenase
MSMSTQAAATTAAYYSREQESSSSSLNHFSSIVAVALASVLGAAVVTNTSSPSPAARAPGPTRVGDGTNSMTSREASNNHNHEQTLMATSVKTNDKNTTVDEDDNETTTLLNWSGTHEINLEAKQYYEPETVEEVQDIVQQCYKTNTPFRPVGSGLSPNAIGFHYTARRNKGKGKGSTLKDKTGAMVNLVHLDKILNLDKDNMTVTVQAGARVSQVIDALRPYGLTLLHLASTAEQQIGSFIQVGVHGPGARVAPVDELCTSLTIVTPFMGTVTLSGPSNSSLNTRKKQPLGNQRLRQHLSETFVNAPSLDPLFQICKVGLGSLGIVTEVTLQFIQVHNLVEHAHVVTRKQAKIISKLF